jgi:hypothetical protein
LPTKKVTTKKTAPKKTTKNKKVKKNDKLVCEKCGLVLSVDTICGCVDACDVLCCGKEMKLKC